MTSTPSHWLDDLFEHVVKFSRGRELCTLSRVNKVLSMLALRALYGSITLDQCPPPAQVCLETLMSNDDRARLVRSLNIQWQRQTTMEAESMSTDQFGDLLKACLMRLVNLERLSLDFNVFETFPSLNDTFPFELISFSTTLPWNEDLVAFLGSQASSLRELRLDFDGGDGSMALGDRLFPDIRVLYWGGNASVETLSTILKETWPSLEQLHMKFASIKATEDVVHLLQQYSIIPSRLDFTFDVQGALGCLSGLQTEELWLGGPNVIGSPNGLTELGLSNFDQLKILTFVLTDSTQDKFTPIIRSTACAMWFDQCPALDIVAFQDEEYCDTRKRPG